uniref:Uncharacterized protein n=1 Tax=Parascaris equorum TaxID=6256 RepID=A0A914R8Z6_PAREQ
MALPSDFTLRQSSALSSHGGMRGLMDAVLERQREGKLASYRRRRGDACSSITTHSVSIDTGVPREIHPYFVVPLPVNNDFKPGKQQRFQEDISRADTDVACPQKLVVSAKQVNAPRFERGIVQLRDSRRRTAEIMRQRRSQPDMSVHSDEQLLQQSDFHAATKVKFLNDDKPAVMNKWIRAAKTSSAYANIAFEKSSILSKHDAEQSKLHSLERDKSHSVIASQRNLTKNKTSAHQEPHRESGQTQRGGVLMSILYADSEPDSLSDKENIIPRKILSARAPQAADDCRSVDDSSLLRVKGLFLQHSSLNVMVINDEKEDANDGDLCDHECDDHVNAIASFSDGT